MLDSLLAIASLLVAVLAVGVLYHAKYPKVHPWLWRCYWKSTHLRFTSTI